MTLSKLFVFLASLLLSAMATSLASAGVAQSTATSQPPKKKILVVGGAGYIGSTTAATLLDAGYDVFILDDLSTGHRELALGSGLTVARAGDDAAVSKLLKKEKFDAVMYFAAKSQVGESFKIPEAYWENNVDQTIKFLDMMLEAGTKTFIFSSTAATYGNPEMDFITEEHPQIPINPYGETKLAVEKYLIKLARERGLLATALRYFNASGTESQFRVGERHDPETHLIPLVLRAILTGNPIKVFGTDYDTKDGTAIRDYIHVSDLARAHILAMEWLFKQPQSKGIFDAFNLGSKNGYSVREIISAAEKVTGRKVPFVDTPRREGDPARLVADSSKAERVLGFKTKLGILDIMKSAWTWESAVCQQVFGK